MLKPKKAEVQLIYECPKCGMEWSKTPKEVILLGCMLCLGCDTFMVFEPIEIVKVTPIYLNESSNLPKNRNSSEPALTNLQKTAIIALTERGFPKKETVEFIKNHSFQSVEDYIQGAIRKGLE